MKTNYIAFALVAVLAGCTSPLSEFGAHSGRNTAQLTVKVRPAGERTVIPASLAIDRYRLTAEGPGDPEEAFSDDGMFAVSGLEPGDWSIAVTAIDSGDRVLLQGFGVASVEADEAKSLEIALFPFGNGTDAGSFSISVTWPAGIAPDEVVANWTGTDVPLTITGNGATCAADVPSGVTQISLQCKKNGRRYSRVLFESLYILIGHETVWNANLEAADFGEGAVVTYRLGPEGDGVAPVDDNIYPAGFAVPLAENEGNALSRADYSTEYFIAAWNTSEDGTGDTYYVGTTFAIGSDDVNLYPVWVSTAGLSMDGSTIVAGYPIADTGTFVVPEGVTAIGDGAFANSAFAGVTLPSTLKTIGNNAFDQCEKLTSVTVPEGVTTIGEDAFHNCWKLASATLPESLESIGANAFRSCSVLTAVTIPKNVASVGDTAFLFDYELAAIQVDPENANYSSREGCLCTKDGTVLIAAPGGLTSAGAPVSLPTVTELRTAAFMHCTKLTGIELPSVATVGENAFNYCRSLETIAFGPDLADIGLYAFKDCPELRSVTFSQSCSLESIPTELFVNCKKLVSIGIPPSVKLINTMAFKGCTALSSVSFGTESVLEFIGLSAFEGCTALTAVTIPPSVKAMFGKAFGSCPNLASVRVEPSVPPTAYVSGGAIFSGNAGLKLYVPTASKEAYLAANGWKTYSYVTF